MTTKNKALFGDIYTGRWKYLTVRTIANFVYCKRKAILELLFPKQVLKQKHVIIGKILHEVHYEIHKNGIDNVEMNLNQVIEQIKTKWNLQNREIISEIKSKIKRMIETHRDISPNEIIKAEVPISSKNGKIRGKIDLLIGDSVYEVKFPSKQITKPFLNDIIQAFIYGVLFLETIGKKEIHVFLDYPLFGLTYEVDLKDVKLLEATENAIEALVEYSFVEELPPIEKSKKCEYCELRELCWSL